MEHKDMQLRWENMRKGIEGQSVLPREALRALSRSSPRAVAGHPRHGRDGCSRVQPE